MCMLCLLQRWSRRVATMLPWLAIPFIIIWSLSQLLPPSLRFEITSPRLACVAVLLATLFWYEILMPRLSVWRSRRAARARDRVRSEALELQKRRKTATRHCRNCRSAYRNQTPGGGRFTCSYCGHISKKPVLGPTAGFGLKHRWLCGKLFGVGLSKEDGGCELGDRGLLTRKAEIGFKESRGEKARRKAEEKRQARLEKELLEEEERKQKEEVARLVEERRRIRDEKMVAEKKDCSKGSSVGGRKGIDRRKEKEGIKSCISNFDCEERKHEFLKKSEKSVLGKVSANKTRCFDGMKGGLLSSSRNTKKSAGFLKSVKPIDHAQNAVKRKDVQPVSFVAKSVSSAGENTYEANLSQPVATDVQPKTGFKMSWHQLFTHGSAVSSDPDSNPITHKTEQLLARGDLQSYQNFLPNYSKTQNKVQIGKALPIGNPISHVVPETTFHPLKEPLQSSVSEDASLFEDRCHVRDPMSLIGPVSESLDSFPLHLEAEFAKTNTEQYPLLNSVYTSAEMNKPLPIECSLLKSEEIHTKSDQHLFTPRPDVSTNRHEQSTWQMWGSPWAHEGLGLLGCPSGLFSIIGHDNSRPQDVLHSLPHKPIMPAISNNHNIQHIHANNHQQAGRTYSHVGPSLKGHDIWLKNSPFRSPLQVDGDDCLLPLNLMDDITHIDATYRSPNHSFETHQASSWSQDDLISHAPQEAVNMNSGSANVGSLFSRGPDVPSMWSFN